MSEPQRIQLRRVKGWRMPSTAVSVARPTRWGNPFKVGGFYLNRSAFHHWPYPAEGPARTRAATDHWTKDPYLEVVAVVIDRRHAAQLFGAHIAGENAGHWSPENIRRYLEGRDLACWCPLDQPCHANILLEIANA